MLTASTTGRTTRTVAARAALVLVNALYIPLIAALLGAIQYGLYAAALASAMVFLSLSLAGSNWRLAVDIAHAPDDSKHLAGRFFAVRLVTAIPAAICLIVWGWLTGGDDTPHLLVPVLAVMIILRSLAAIFAAVLIGRGHSDIAMNSELAGRIGEVILATAGIYLLALGPVWVACAVAVNWGAQLLFLGCRARPIRFPERLTPSLSQVLATSWPYAVLGTLLTFMSQAPLVLAPETLSPVHALGWIGLAVSVLTAGLSLVGSFMASLAQPIARSARHGSAFVIYVYLSGMALSILAGILAYTTIDMFGRRPIEAVLGHDYLGFIELAAPVGCLVASLLGLNIAANILGYYEKVALASLSVAVGAIITPLILQIIGGPASATKILYAVSAGATISVLLLGLLFAVRHIASRQYSTPS